MHTYAELKEAAEKAGMETDLDQDRGIALRPRLYDDEGRRMVRLAPDPCEYTHTIKSAFAALSQLN